MVFVSPLKSNELSTSRNICFFRCNDNSPIFEHKQNIRIPIDIGRPPFPGMNIMENPIWRVNCPTAKYQENVVCTDCILYYYIVVYYIILYYMI